MRRTARLFRIGTLAAAVTFVGACGPTYFKISHPGTDEVYYARDDSIKRRGASLEFKDEATGAIVTLSNAQRVPITKEEFRANTGTD